MSRFLVFILALAAAPVAAAQPAATDSRLMALLPLDRSDATLTSAEWRILEEAMITASSKLVLPLGYVFLNSDTTLQLFDDNAVDAQKACDRSCALGVAREIKARFFLSGAVASAEGSHIAFVRLLDSGSGAQLDAVKLEGVTVKELVAQFERKAEGFFSKLPALGPGQADAKIGGGTTAPVLGQKTVLVTFESTPPGAFVSLDGKALCPSTPCRKAVPLGTHAVSMQKERYDTAGGPREITGATTIALTLEPLFGWVTVTSEPPGLPVAIDGTVVGKAPIEKLELEPGPHEIVVEDPCHVRTGERVTIARNVARNVAIKSEQKRAALDVMAEDEQKNAIDAAIIVDGREVGTAPAQVVVSACARRLELRAPNRAPWATDLVLTEGETRRIEGLLAGTVMHHFKSRPDGQVLLDGVQICEWTPCDVPVRPGPHTVTFTRRGYDPVEVAVDIGPGGETEVNLEETYEREAREERARAERMETFKAVGGRLVLAGAAAGAGIYAMPGFLEGNGTGSPANHGAWLTPLFSSLLGAAFVDELDSTWLGPFIAANTLSLTMLLRSGNGGFSGSDVVMPVFGFLTGATVRSIGFFPDIHDRKRSRPSTGRWVAGVVGSVAAAGSAALLAQANGTADGISTLGGLLLGGLTPLAIAGMWRNVAGASPDEAGKIIFGTTALIMAQGLGPFVLLSGEERNWNFPASQLAGLALSCMGLSMWFED